MGMLSVRFAAIGPRLGEACFQASESAFERTLVCVRKNVGSLARNILTKHYNDVLNHAALVSRGNARRLECMFLN